MTNPLRLGSRTAWNTWMKVGPCGRRMMSSLERGLSFTQGSNEPPLLTQTIPEHFSQTVSNHGDRTAVIAYPPSTSSLPPSFLSYYDLDVISNSLASSLRSLGVSKGSRVAVSLGNSAEFASLTYAIFKLGAILVPLNPVFSASQVKAALSHLGVEVLVIGAVTDLAYKPGRGRANKSLLEDVLGDLTGKLQSEEVDSLRNVVIVDNREAHDCDWRLGSCRALTRYEELLEGDRGRVVPEEDLKADETINIQFTSGTTSMPKAAMLSHTAILNNGALIAGRMGLAPADRIVVPPPLFHCFGSILGYMATATTGASIIFPSPAFDPIASLRAAEQHDATGLYGVTTMLIAMIEALANGTVAEAPKSLVKGIVAGSSVPEALMKRVFDHLGLRDLVICYGMTETAPVSCMTTPHDPFEKRTSTVGRAMPHTAVKIVDPRDRSRVMPVGEEGELAASGYLVMAGYFGDDEKTAEVRSTDSDGRTWMYSGDEARIDQDGYVQITGRIKDLIIRGGENIHPLEIENCLFQHPGVAEVSVVGVPDEKYGEAVAAFVVRARDGEVDEASVKAWVRERMSGYLVPKWVFWVDEYPKTASGKIQKFKLREMARDLMRDAR